MKKNLYLLALLLSIGSSAVAQVNENSNWIFGYHGWLDFQNGTTTPTVVAGAQMNTWASCASVSDENGDLLFYSNGITAWNYNHQVMTNGSNLYGNIYGSQSVMIIPKSLTDKTYYLITLDGFTGVPSPEMGFHYSEVDMSNGGEIIASTKNTVLKDHLGIDINQSYGNKSLKMTATIHSNGTDYWLVVQMKDYIYSYLVTQYGISSTPTTVSASPININDPVAPGYTGPGYGQMKISPDTHHIVLSHFDYPFPGVQQGGLLFGSFDNTTGAVTLAPFITVPGEQYYFGVEFSANSQYYYFYTDRSLKWAHVSTPTALSSTPNPYYPDYDFSVNMQRGIDGKIYSGNYWNDYLSEVSVIHDPNNPLNPDFQPFSLNVAPAAPFIGFPQLVPIQPDCEQYIVLSNPDGNSAPFTYSYSDYIVDNQNYTVDNGQDITQKAGNFISIEPDTYIKPGSLFLAEITPCTGTKGDIKGKASRPVADTPGLKISSDLLIYPNPAKGSVNIAVNTGTLSQVIITSLSGQVLYNTAVPAAQNNISVNVSNYAAGIYFVSAKTNEGKQFTQKLVVE